MPCGKFKRNKQTERTFAEWHRQSGLADERPQSNTYWQSGQASERSRPEQDAEWRKFAQEEFVVHEGARTGLERSGLRR